MVNKTRVPRHHITHKKVMKTHTYGGVGHHSGSGVHAAPVPTAKRVRGRVRSARSVKKL